MNPCNVCGGTDLVVKNDWYAGVNGFRIQCAVDWTRFSSWASTKDAAIADWNMRNPVDSAGKPRKINDCRSCGAEPGISEDRINCGDCFNAHGHGYKTLDEWNDANPDVESIEAQLEECCKLINLLVEAPYAALETIDIKAMAVALVLKHKKGLNDE